MVFSSAEFLFLFLPVAIGIYYIPLIRKNTFLNNIWLLLISLFFYAWGEPLYVLLMIASICMNYFFGRLVDGKGKTRQGKCLVALACIYNIGVLFIFKYLSWILGILGFTALSKSTALALPIGISFYTFQALSYVIDVYRKKDKAQKNIMNVGLYISFFPQLIAGPIVRYGSIAKQLQSREHSFDKFSEGIRRFIVGLCKKIILANQLAQLSDLTFGGTSQLSVALAWGGALSYMLQVYFDFSGYSDMAIGLGKMFGFEFEENFNYPFVSKSLGEYWRRWHISLCQWFRDYLFYPLTFGPAVKVRKWCGKRFSRKTASLIASSFVSLTIWFATGLWHGANTTFVIWGLLNFGVIFLEKFRKPLKNKKLDALLGFSYTILFGLFTKVIFKSDTLSQAMHYLGSMVGLSGNSLVDNMAIYWIGQYKIVILSGLLFAFPVIPFLNRKFEKYHLEKFWNALKSVVLMLLFIVCCSYAIGGGYNPFIYFNF